MALIGELNAEIWNTWLATRPQSVQDLARRLPPNRLYRLKSSGRRVTIHSYSEDGTLTVNITGQYNYITFNRRVFGIAPDNLEECDWPDEHAMLGTMLTEPNDVDAFIDFVREDMAKKRMS